MRRIAVALLPAVGAAAAVAPTLMTTSSAIRTLSASCKAHTLASNGTATFGNKGSTSPGAPPPTTIVPISTPPLAIVGDEREAQGIFDPSLLATTNASIPFLMTYSGVTETDNISTHLSAYDAASGVWVHVAAVNGAEQGTLPCGGGPCVGSFIHETSSLILDATDPNPAALFKVLTHSYIVTGGNELHYDWGHIRLWTSPVATGPWTGTALFGWAGASPLSTDGVRLSLTGIPELADCIVFSEPGAILLDGGASLLVSLGCVSLPAVPTDPAPIRIVSLISPDHGATWVYTGVLLDGAVDAAALGYAVPQLNAADLFVGTNTSGSIGLYLIASPAGPVFGGSFDGYTGCLVFQVETASPGRLGVVRDAVSGAPVVMRSVVPSDPQYFAGACSAATSATDPGRVGGYLLPTLMPGGGPGGGPLFTILPSFQAPV